MTDEQKAERKTLIANNREIESVLLTELRETEPRLSGEVVIVDELRLKLHEGQIGGQLRSGGSLPRAGGLRELTGRPGDARRRATASDVDGRCDARYSSRKLYE